jgi:hypothetical protein
MDSFHRPAGCVAALIGIGGPAAAILGGSINGIECWMNIRGKSLLDGIDLFGWDYRWQYRVSAATSGMVAGLAALLMVGCIASLVGRDWGRRAFLWSCGLYLPLTLAFNIATAASHPKEAGLFLGILVMTVPYPAVTLLLLRRRFGHAEGLPRVLHLRRPTPPRPSDAPPLHDPPEQDHRDQDADGEKVV